jgi:anaerobic selenocysteine-containing dehydrogenase
LLAALAALDPASLTPPPAYPLVLSAGQRRLQNANQILRDPAFRQRDPDGALTVHPDDLAALGAADGQWLRVVSPRGALRVRARADDTMRPGHVALPHGYGQAHPDALGQRVVQGPRVNLLTDSAWCDPVAGTPYHKHVPVRLELLVDDAPAMARGATSAVPESMA